MTHISQFAVKDFDAYENSNELKEYQVEVITFDGESETVYVDAYNEDTNQRDGSFGLWKEGALQIFNKW